MTYKEMASAVAAETGLSARLVDGAYRAYWRAVREHVGSLPLKEGLSDGEFLRLRPNVNLPSVGKLSVTLGRYKGVKRKHERLTRLRDATHNEDKAPVHLDSDHGRQV